MKTFGRFAMLVLPFALCCTLTAQQNNSSTHHQDAPQQATVSRGSATSAPAPSGSIVRSYVTGNSGANSSQPPRTNPQPPRYHNGGGYAYYPYAYYPYSYAPYNSYIPTPLATGQTATDRVIANGGTFTRVESAPGEVQPESQAPTTQANPQSFNNLPSAGVGSPLPTTFAGAADRIPEMNSTAVEESPAILVYSDGHTVQVSNYAVFAGSVLVLGGERRRIPLRLLDLRATMTANDKAGYTFRIPAVYLQ